MGFLKQEMNEPMSKLLAKLRGRASMPIDSGLASYVRGEFRKTLDGALMANVAASNTVPLRAAFPDRTAYEAFVSKIHISDWLSGDDNPSAQTKLEQALLLADLVGEHARQMLTPVTVIVSCELDGDDVVLRFHVTRRDEPDWLDDVNAHSEPVLLRRYTQNNEELGPTTRDLDEAAICGMSSEINLAEFVVRSTAPVMPTTGLKALRQQG